MVLKQKNGLNVFNLANIQRVEFREKADGWGTLILCYGGIAGEHEIPDCHKDSFNEAVRIIGAWEGQQ